MYTPFRTLFPLNFRKCRGGVAGAGFARDLHNGHGATIQVVIDGSDGKPAAIMGASPGAMGTARAQYHLRQMLVFLNMFPINQPEVMIAHAEERFDQEGNLTDTITKEFILALLQNLVEWTRRIGTLPPQSRVKDI